MTLVPNVSIAGASITTNIHKVERVAIVASPDKPAATETLLRMQRWLKGRAEVVFAEITYDSRQALPLRPDLLFSLGGDGTLIAAVDSLGQRQIPIVGVNLGKLGYLADFTIEELEHEGDFLFAGELPITRRIMMDVQIEHADGSVDRTPAINDCVILAGPPFNMIQVAVSADGESWNPSISADGPFRCVSELCDAVRRSAGVRGPRSLRA